MTNTVISSTDCISFGRGSPQVANLGDGNGPQPQIFELREDFGNAQTGVCIEQLIGGNHFRYALERLI